MECTQGSIELRPPCASPAHDVVDVDVVATHSTDQALRDGVGVHIASLHPEAVALGYRFISLDLLDGLHGPFQRITLTRRRTGV